MQIAQQLPDFSNIGGGRQIFGSPPTHSLHGSYYGPNAYESISPQPLSNSSMSHHGQVHYSNFESNLPAGQPASYFNSSAQLTNEFDTFADSSKSSFINGGYHSMPRYPIRPQSHGKSINLINQDDPRMMPLSYSVPPMDMSGKYNLNHSGPNQDRINYNGINAPGKLIINFTLTIKI